MKSLKRFLIVVAVLAVLLGVLDRVTCWWAENEATQALERRGAENATVKVNDLPFLTSIISGNINQVAVTTPRFDIASEGGALPVTNVTAQLNNLQLSPSRLNIDKIGRLKVQADLSGEALSRLVAQKAPEVKVRLSQGKLTFSTTKWGQEILADGQIELSGGLDGVSPTLVVKPTALKTQLPSLLSARIQLPDFLPALNIPISGIPASLQLKSAEVKADHLVLKLEGSNILMPKDSNS
ncbi:Uncharacterised protein [Chlamydia trachomatis]|nr:Uncharacterised protein [Chlamydia trachomatis]